MTSAANRRTHAVVRRPIMFMSALLIVIASGKTHAEGVNWVVAPYLWGSDVGLAVTVNDDPVLGTEAAFTDLVDKLDMAFMGHVEVQADRFGGFFDIIYIDLSDATTVDLGPGGPILGEIALDTSLELNIYELGGYYRFPAANNQANFDLLLGGRKIEAGIDADVTLPGPGEMPVQAVIDNSETDIFGGARVVGNFNERWGYKARIDYGAGGSEGSLNALATVGYTFGESGLFTLDFGYRYFSVEFEKGLDEGSAKTEITMSGPVVGFIFQW